MAVDTSNKRFAMLSFADTGGTWEPSGDLELLQKANSLNSYAYDWINGYGAQGSATGVALISATLHGAPNETVDGLTLYEAAGMSAMQAVIVQMSKTHIDDPEDTSLYDKVLSTGWSDGSAQYTQALFAEYGLNTSGTALPSVVTKFHSDALVGVVLDTATTAFAISVNAFTSSGVQFKTEVNNVPYPVGMTVILLGGSGVKAKVGQFQLTGSAQSVTGVGFQPTHVMFGTVGDSTTTAGAVSGIASYALGAVDSSLNQNMYAYAELDGVTAGQSYSVINQSASFAVKESTLSYTYTVAVSSLDADGFTIDAPVEDG